MSRKPKSVLLYWILFVVATAFTMLSIGCGGGGGDSSSPATNTTDRSSNGTVALYLTDAPTDEFDHIWIELSSISMIGGDGEAPQIIFETEDPKPIDLLALRDGDTQLLGVDHEIPTGNYSKIRLEVESIKGEKEGKTIKFNLASRKIDLNPQQEIDLDEDQSISIVIDIDADKSIHIAGPNYNFRPVVFVAVNPVNHPILSRSMLSGEIEELVYDEGQPDSVSGFRLNLFHGIHTIDVILGQDAVIIDDQGDRAGTEALEAGQQVQLAGQLDSDGKFIADRVVIGEIATFFGTVNNAVESDQFQLTAVCRLSDPEDGEINVAVSADTIVVMDGIEAGLEQIQPGQKACVAGKYDEETQVLKAVAIFIKAPRIVGNLTAVAPADGGNLLTISQYGEETTIFMPQDVTPSVQGSDALTVEDLSSLIACEPPLVQVTVDRMPTEETPAQAIALDVLPQMIEVTAANVDTESRTITTDGGQTIVVAEDAILMLHTMFEQQDSDLAAIKQGDTLLVAALKTCDSADYSSAMIIKLAPFELPCMPQYESVEITVEHVNESAITATDGTLLEVSERTILVDHSQHNFGKMAIEDIEAGDILLCDILKPCDEEGAAEVLLIRRINPDAEDTDGDTDPGDICHPEPAQMDATVESISDDIITTTAGETIQVPERTPIVMEAENGAEPTELKDLKAGDRLEIFTFRSCEDDSQIAVWILVTSVAK